jgi:hypothetical protein
VALQQPWGYILFWQNRVEISEKRFSRDSLSSASADCESSQALERSLSVQGDDFTFQKFLCLEYSEAALIFALWKIR